jgi:hypothetical protein
MRPGQLRNAPIKRSGSFTTRPVLVPGKPSRLSPQRSTGRKDTGFSATVKAAVRERARYRCEACGAYLGDCGGQLQHRLARRMGGSRSPLISTAANAALLCGTPNSGCHGRAESRDRDMNAEGFWLESWQSPLAEPIMLHGSGSGVTVWLTEDGHYSLAPVGGGIA